MTLDDIDFEPSLQDHKDKRKLLMETTIYVLMAVFACVIYYANVNDKIEADGIIEQAIEGAIEETTGLDIELSPDDE